MLVCNGCRTRLPGVFSCRVLLLLGEVDLLRVTVGLGGQDFGPGG